MRKLCVKLYNATSYPPLGPVFKNIFFFFKNILLPYLKCKTCSKVYIWKVSMRRMKDIFNQGPQFCVKWVDALLFHENGVAIIFTCKMNRNIHRCTFWTNPLWQFSVGSLIIGFSGVFPKLTSHLPLSEVFSFIIAVIFYLILCLLVYATTYASLLFRIV